VPGKTTHGIASRLGVVALCVAFGIHNNPVSAHPHVFVDGGVDFVFGTDGKLVALNVAWHYDAFETLYILASHDLTLNTDGGLDEADRLALVKYRSEWPEDFDGSAHLSVDQVPVALEWPAGLDAHIIDGRLRITFRRELSSPLSLSGVQAELAFYESTYFFAFSITEPPKLLGTSGDCKAEVVTFDPSAENAELRSTLSKLGREETPAIANVGSLFADRISLSCR